MGQEAGVGSLEADTSLQPELAQGDHVLRVASVNSFVGVEESALAAPEAGCLIQRELGRIGNDGLRNLAVIRSWPISKRPNLEGMVVVTGIGVRAKDGT